MMPDNGQNQTDNRTGEDEVQALWKVAAAAEKAREAQRAYFAARTPVRLRVSKAP